jgi:tripartite-type tricarboxylate transporter receptor subunit TctC
MTTRTSMSFVGLVAAASLTAACASTPQQEYPSDTVTLIAPFEAGGLSDLTARVAADCFEQRTGEQFIVENRSGGGGVVGATELAQSEPDGYTLGVTTLSVSVLVPLVTDGSGYTGQDFAPVGGLTLSPSALVVPKDSPFDTAEQFFSAARAKPDTLSVSMPGSSGVYALTMSQIGKTGAVTKQVPFESNDLSVSAVLGGNVDAGFVAISPTLLQQIKSGKVKALATGSDHRLGYLPDLPTLAEAGYDNLPESGAYLMLVAPKGLPQNVSTELSSLVKKCVDSTNFTHRLGEQFVLNDYVGNTQLSTLFRRSETDYRAILGN